MAAMEECESGESVTNERSVIEKFCAITGASEDVAGRLLEACGGNIDLAIGMHLDSAEEGRESPHQETSGEDAGDVRAPIPQKNEKLVEESHSVPTFGRRKRTTNCIFDALRDFEAETRVQEEREGGPSGAAANKRRTLQDLFRPPLDLIHKGTFQSTRMAASQANKWLLINIQNAQEFCCQILNRDVWSSSKVKTIVRRHFIFWQGYHDSSEGQRFMQFYNINTWPYIAVLDPRTGEKMAVWHTRDADTLTELLREFTEQYPAPDGSAVEPPNKVQRRRDSIMDASEESQLETAIRLSLTETNKDKRPDLDLNVLTDDDDTDDMLETFSSSDSDTECPKQSRYSIKGSSTRSSPAAAAAAAGSETASRQNQSEANTYESEDGASNCVCVNGAESAASTPDVQDGVSREPPTVDHSRQNSGGETHRSIGHGSDKSVGHHSLPGRSSVDEGSLSNGSTTRVQIRFPDGLKKVLALPKCSSVQTLTQFVEKQGYPTVDYKLVTTFPKRQLSQMSPGSTLEDIGFCSQEIVYVQSVS